MSKLFEDHPLPWEYKKDYSSCGNGSSLDAIFDAKGECIANSYGGTSFNALWSLYCMFSDEELLEREKTR